MIGSAVECTLSACMALGCYVCQNGMGWCHPPGRTCVLGRACVWGATQLMCFQDDQKPCGPVKQGASMQLHPLQAADLADKDKGKEVNLYHTMAMAGELFSSPLGGNQYGQKADDT